MDNRYPIHEFVLKFLAKRGVPTGDITFNPISGDGSKRLFIRAEHRNAGQSFVVVENRPDTDFQKKENLAYLMIGRHLLGKGIPLPEICDHDLERGWFILEDLGDVRLQDEVLGPGLSDRLLEDVIEILLRMQTEGIRGFQKEWCCQTERYDRFVMRRLEADYFRDSFLSGYLGIKAEWPELEGAFDHLSETSAMADGSYFLHRDFQSRNIMIRDKRVGILDWQGGRIGPLGYDLASFLFDPYINIPGDQKMRLYGQYLSLLRDYNPSLTGEVERSFPYLAIQRNLQILGAFSYLTKVLGKTYFSKYIPTAIRSLYLMLDELADPRLSSLKDIVHKIKEERYG